MMTQNLVWHDTAWWLERGPELLAHDTTVSTVDPRLVAYFPNAAKRAADVRTRVKPGRYLTQFFSDVLTAKQIAYFAAWQSSGKAPAANDDATPAVQFATTPDEIEHVYVNGPSSCMSYAPCHYSSAEHPTRVYGAGDLAIAYLTDPDDGDKIVSRTLCWPERKVFGRLYPNESVDRQNELKAALMAIGYQPHQIASQRFDGARMLRIEHAHNDNIFIMPYLDCPANGFNDDGEYLILKTGYGDAEYQGSNTHGLSADPEPEYDWHCDCCGDGQTEDDCGNSVYTRAQSGYGGRGEQMWCDGCYRYNGTFYCEGFHETFASNYVDSVEIEGDTYSRQYAMDNFSHSDLSDAWFTGESVEVGGATWSQDEFEEHGFTCAIDGENYTNSDMHPQHPGVHKDVDAEVIAEWLAACWAARGPTPTILDDNQIELCLWAA